MCLLIGDGFFAKCFNLNAYYFIVSILESFLLQLKMDPPPPTSSIFKVDAIVLYIYLIYEFWLQKNRAQELLPGVYTKLTI